MHCLKRVAVILIPLLALMMVAADVFAAGDVSKGVMGIEWRTKVSEIPQLQKLYSKGPVDYYSIPTRAASIGDVTLSKVVYGFYEGQFFASFLEIHSESDFAQLRTTLTDRFGTWKKSQTMEDEGVVFQWKSGDVKIKLKASRKTGRMKLGFYFEPLAAALNSQRMEQNEKKAFEFFPIQRDKKPDALPFLTF